MQILLPIIISALMVLGSVAWTNEHKAEPLGANTLISALSTGTSLDDADHLIYNDNSGTPTTKKITVANATSSLQTWFDPLYEAELNNSAGLLAALSDETGTGVAVFNDTPTIGSPILNTPTFNVAGTDATGDTYYNGGSGLFSRLAIGSSGQFLMASSTGLPVWSSDILSTTVTASTTFLATTTIEASNLTNKALVLNGLAYKFPSSRTSTSSVLMTDSLGNLSWNIIATSSYGTISNFSDLTCATGGGGTDTDTYINHGLGTTPSSVTITAELDPTGASSAGTGEGTMTWNNSGTIISGFIIQKNGGATEVTGNTTAFTASGSGNPSVTITLSVPSATSSSFLLRANCTSVTSDSGTNSVSNIKWTASR